MRKDYKCPCHFSVEEWYKIQVPIYIFLDDLALKGLIQFHVRLAADNGADGSM